MNELRPNDDSPAFDSRASDSRASEPLTTADIARSTTGRQARTADTDGDDEQPILLPASSPSDGAAAGATAGTANNNPGTAANNPGPLFPDEELHNFRARWDSVQTSFVDEPRQAVEHADSLVANVVQRIAEQFANERAKLENQWAKGDNVSTEDLRQSLKRYHSFFDRLLSF